jgi:hypothetical protein
MATHLNTLEFKVKNWIILDFVMGKLPSSPIYIGIVQTRDIQQYGKKALQMKPFSVCYQFLPTAGID